MTRTISHVALIARIISAGFVFGLLAFVCGYFGPIYLLPDPGVGPLTGFLGAPCGIAIGAATAAHASFTGLHGWRYLIRLFVVAGICAVVLLAIVVVQ